MQLVAGRPCQGQEAGLARLVGGAAHVGPGARHAAHEEHVAARFQQPVETCLDAVEGAGQRDRENLVPALGAQPPELPLGDVVRGRADQDVEALQGTHEAPHRCPIGDVQGNWAPPRDAVDVDSGCLQAIGDGGADAGRAARDHRHPPGELRQGGP